MTVRVGINGFGRIGRNFFRAVRASGADIEIVGVNDLTDNASLAHLLKYDTILGRLDADVTSTESAIRVGDQEIAAFAERDPSALKWGDIGADVVVESTGFFTNAAISGYYAAYARGFPAYARATGTGFVLGVGRLGAAGSPIIAGFLFTALGNDQLLTVSIIMAMGSVISLILFLMLPEREGDAVVGAAVPLGEPA